MAASLIILPVALSITAASLIDRFRFFFLIIPWLWCYAVSCLLVKAVNVVKFQASAGPLIAGILLFNLGANWEF